MQCSVNGSQTLFAFVHPVHVTLEFKQYCDVSQRLNELWTLLACVTLLKMSKVSRVNWCASGLMARRGVVLLRLESF
jgi:hypothetical protein